MSALTPSLESAAFPMRFAEARRGNADAFASLIWPYSQFLYRRALRLTANSADAEDIRQEALFRAFSRLHQFEGAVGPNEFAGWLGRIASNASIDLLRRRRDKQFVPLDAPSSSEGSNDEPAAGRVPDRCENPEERFARRQLRLRLAKAIRALPPDLRRVCLLRDVMHYSTQEVADRLGVSLMAVRLRLYRAHGRLRDLMREDLRARTASRLQRPARKRAALPGNFSAPSDNAPLRAKAAQL